MEVETIAKICAGAVIGLIAAVVYLYEKDVMRHIKFILALPFAFIVGIYYFFTDTDSEPKQKFYDEPINWDCEEIKSKKNDKPCT